MAAFAGEFTLTRLERVISGRGTVSALGAELDRRGLTRAVVVTGRTLGASPLLTQVTTSLGDRCADVFTGVRQHVPSGSVQALAALARTARADCLVSFGGGSPIDTTKAALHALLADHPSSADPVVHISIPTTLSAGEFTGVAGVTDEATRVKHGVADSRIAARTIIDDPEVTRDTPDWLWAATGMRAIDHAIESIYSIRHHPVSDALGSAGIKRMMAHLLPSVRAEGDARVDHRAECLTATWMCVFGMTNAGFGLSHAFGHQIGPRWDVPHGVTSCITLPHAMRFMARLAPDRFGPIAAAMEVPFDASHPEPAALACADRMAAFIAQFDLPSRLRDAKVPRAELDEVIGIVHEAMARAQVVDRPVTRDELAAVLAEAY
jgi:alcohol dehydrogenase